MTRTQSVPRQSQTLKKRTQFVALKLSRNKVQKPTIIDLTDDAVEEHTTTEHIKKK